MKRKLGQFESAAAISGEYGVWNIVGILRLDGVPSPEILQKALHLLQDRHPFLRVRLSFDGKHHYFESGNVPEIPLEVLTRLGDDDWIPLAERELNTGFDHPAGPLLRCVYITDGTKADLILTLQHSIGDGTSTEILFHELLSICAALEAGENIQDYEPLAMLAPSEAFFPPDFHGRSLRRKTNAMMMAQMLDEFKYQFNLLGKRKPTINPKSQGRIISMHISADETQAVVRRARKERATLNSVVSAAVLLSVRKHLYNDAHMPFRYMSMADLRPYTIPRVPDNEIGCFTSPLRYTIHISAKDDLWLLARRINQQIYDSAKKGEKYLFAVMAEMFLSMTFKLNKFRMCTTAISNTGTFMLQPTYGHYKVAAVHGFISNFPQGPEYSGRVTVTNGAVVGYALFGYRFGCASSQQHQW